MHGAWNRTNIGVATNSGNGYSLCLNLGRAIEDDELYISCSAYVLRGCKANFE
jgi:hypothetical protein